MIRNRTEYAEALARLADEQARLSEDRARLSAVGLTDDDIQNFLGPLETIRQHLTEEVEAYERARVAAEQASPTADTPSDAPPPAVEISAIVEADGESVVPNAPKRKTAARSRVKAKVKASSSATTAEQETSTPSTAPKSKKSKSKSNEEALRIPKRKAATFGPRSIRAVKKSAGKETRRKFSLQEKARILAEIDSAPHGTKGKVVKQYGLHSPMLAAWRKRVGKSVKVGAGAAARAAREVGRAVDSPKGTSVVATTDSANFVNIVRENSALRTEVAALRTRMEQVKRFVAIQRQLAEEMLGSE